MKWCLQTHFKYEEEDSRLVVSKEQSVACITDETNWFRINNTARTIT